MPWVEFETKIIASNLPKFVHSLIYVVTMIYAVCYKVTMTKLIVTVNRFVNAPTRMWRSSVWFCSWLLCCVVVFSFFPFFLTFFLLSFLLYLIWQGMQNVSAWIRFWYGKLQKVMNFTALISLIPALCSSGKLNPCTFNGGNGSKVQDSSVSNM